jgi:hypothetical protein
MLQGTGASDIWADGAPALSDFGTEELSLSRVEVLQVLYEIKSAAADELLPAGLHPTIPGVVNWLAYACDDSPWGAFRLVQARIECRSGVRPRTLAISGFIDNEAAREALAARWAYRLSPGTIEFQRNYDGAELRVACDGRTVFDLALRDPVLLPEGVLQILTCLHPANTQRGYRLVQVDVDYATNRSERARPELRSCDATAWGDARLDPQYPISAAVCTADVTIGRLRYLCRPDELAFTGTETVE